MTKKVLTLECEKEARISVRYKGIPSEVRCTYCGYLYVQKWFADDSKYLEITIDKKTTDQSWTVMEHCQSS